MASPISPGVYTSITDLSTYVAAVPSTIAFISIICEKGPDNQLTFVGGTGSDFYTLFGEPNINYAGKDWGSGPYVCDSFLKQSQNLYVIRVLPTDAAYANLVVSCDLAYDGSSGMSVDSSVSLKANRYSANIITEDLDTYTTTNSTALIALLNSDGTSAASATNIPIIAFYGVGRGEYYNKYQINISQHRVFSKRQQQIYMLDIFQEQDVTVDNTILNPNYAIVGTFEVSLDPTSQSAGGESIYIEDVVNKYFTDLKCVTNKDVLGVITQNSYLVSGNSGYSEMKIKHYDYTSNPWNFTYNADSSNYVFANYYDASGNFKITQVQGVQLGGGTSGSLFGSGGLINPTVAGQLLEQSYSGTLPRYTGDTSSYVDEVLDTENYYFNIVLDGGYPDTTSSSVKSYIGALTQLRMDCLAIIDNEDQTNPANAYINRTAGDTFDYDSKFVAIYDGFSLIADEFTGKKIWMTPVYHMANIIPYTDNVTNVWWAPAGFNRAMLTNVSALRYSPNLGWRDQYYQQQLNPIVKFNVGYSVFSQLTSQRRPTALQNVNVIRLVLYIQRALQQYCKYYVFELNDATTWNSISADVNMFLKQIQNKRGLYSYSVDVGATPYELQAKQCHVNVTLNPELAIEQIFLNFFVQ